MNHKTLTIAVLIFSLLLTALMLRRGDLAWLALPFLVYLAAGIFLSPARESIHLQAERVVNRTSAGELALVEVRVTVRNLGVNLDRVDLSDLLPEGVRASQGQVNKRTALRSGEEAQLTYSFREKRGSYTWKNVRAVVSDPFGLVETAYLLPARGEIQVQPERDALRRLPLRPRSTLHSPGSIPARLGGSGTDFWGVREYQPGDPLRWLDWRLTARHPHKFFSKEFEQEEIADIGLILDAREKTDLRLEDAAHRGAARQEVAAHPIDAAHRVDAAQQDVAEHDADSLFEHSVSATAGLAEAFLHQGHRVSLMMFGGEIETVFPGYGKVQLNKIMRCLAHARTGTNSLADVIDYLPLRMFSRRALLIVFSPLAPNDWPFFLRLRASGYQGLLISPNPFEFMT